MWFGQLNCTPDWGLPMPRVACGVLAAVLVILLSAGCARTTMTSMPSPELRGRTYHSIIVFAQIEDLGLRAQMEDRFVEQADQTSPDTGIVWSESAQKFIPRPGSPRFRALKMIASHRVFYPGRDYSSDEVTSIMRTNGIDASLVISPRESGSIEGYVPPTYTSRCTSFNALNGCSQVTTTSSGGFSYSNPWQTFSAKLYDAADGQIVWISTATSTGNAFARTADLVQSMADKTVERLAADKMIQ